jgi:hypothetical protein
MTKSVAKTTKKQQGFEKGKSGNPKGRPQGSRNKATIACQNLIDGEAEALTLKAIELAKDGDITALRLCLDRLVPTRRDSPVNFELPSIDTPSDLSKATATVAIAVSNGTLTPVEGELVSKTLQRHVKALELTDIEKRLQTLEAQT